ncbi:MAG TPA: type II toxin-antitoxin system VapC family toxin [Steroidobacteraceae bacterium]|nr:type II toxin-antitoxin system VapC family toxin [Steroidobacteraceae bacterium]
MITVIDASVIVKWLLQNPRREAGTAEATRLMERVANGEQPVLQPTHWILEVGAVLARESPDTAVEDVGMLAALELPATDDPRALGRGIALAMELKQHVFDTYYHGIALETPDCMLVTADERYLRAAHSKGRIMDLTEWERLRTRTDVTTRSRCPA